MEHPAFRNQDLIDKCTTVELMQLANIREMCRSLSAVIDYLEREQESVFRAVRARLPMAEGGESNVQAD